MSPSRGSRRALWALFFVVAACMGDDGALARLGDGCVLDSDCEGSLVCVFRTCHDACRATADCPAGARCVKGPEGGVCQLDDDARCALHSDCPGDQICAPDGECRDECKSSSDCLGDQVCAQGACAEPSEVGEDGRLVGADELTGEGAPCTVSSDCDPLLQCIEGKCLLECVDHFDCPSGECKNGHCIPLPGGGPACVPGKQRSCDDPIGDCTTQQGIQKCAPSKTWGPCVCVPPGTMTGGMGGMGGMGGVGGTVAGTGGGASGGAGGVGTTTSGNGGFGGVGGSTTTSSTGGAGGVGGMGTTTTTSSTGGTGGEAGGAATSSTSGTGGAGGEAGGSATSSTSSTGGSGGEAGGSATSTSSTGGTGGVGGAGGFNEGGLGTAGATLSGGGA